MVIFNNMQTLVPDFQRADIIFIQCVIPDSLHVDTF